MKYYVYNELTKMYANINNRGDIFIHQEMKSLYKTLLGANNVVKELNDDNFKVYQIGGNEQ